jgi:hypothetical protein
MAISPEKSNRTSAADALSSQPAPGKSLYRKILYRGAFFVALAACVVSLAALAGAQAGTQQDRPQISPNERKVPRKKEAGPRALGVLRLTTSGKATLVPITILMSGKFYDASAYKAAPVPMALESGVVYEGVRTGTSEGLFTVDGALHSTTANSQTPWIGTGQWLVAGAEATKKAMKAEDVPVGIETSDGPPRLSRGGSAPKDAQQPTVAPQASPSSSPSSPGSSTPSSTAPSSTAPSTTPSSTTSPSSAPTGSPTSTTTGPSTSGSGSSNPPAAGTSAPPATDSKPAKTDDSSKDSHAADKQSSAPNESDNNSGAGDNNRPRLRRGKPVDPLPEEEIPGYARPGSKASTPAAPSAEAGKNPTAPALVPVQLIPAISDASGPEPRSYAFQWLKGEEDERRKQISDLAKQQVKAYLDAQAKAKIVPKVSGPKAAAHKAAPKTADPVLENAKMNTYDLWTTNQPVIVFSAEAHLPPARAGTAQSVAETDMEYSIVLVVRTDIYNDLHKLYVGVTDKYHLDITPRLELVDAVDVDGDGRGELLFRETSDAGGGWLIYRASADKLWKMFDSLNPE